MLEYIIEREDWEMFNDHAMDLVDNIFGDSDSLRTVLKFLDKHEVKLEHLETWLSQGHLAIAQFTKLMKYAKIHSDQEMQILLEEYGEILTSTNSYENNYTMKILLNHYLKNNLGKGLVKIIDLTCIDKPKLQKILTRLLKSKPPIMVLPINVGSMHSPKGTSNIHWTTFFIYPLRGQPPLIIYLDPFGKEIPLLLSDVLKNLYPNAKVVNPRIKILDHVSDCGLWLIITLDSLVNQRDPLISMENARQNHLELMANHVANNLSAEETTHSSKFLRNKTLPNLARILTFPISKHKSKGRVSRILRETHSFRPYRSFAAERERQILRQVATQLYLSLKNNFPKLGEVQAMHLSHDENNYLFIAVNQRNVTNELAKFIKDKNTFRELLTKTYKPSRDPEGKIRSRRYATKLAKRIFGTDIQLPTSKNTSDGEQAHMVAKLLRGGTWSTLPLKSANDVLHLENNKIYLVLPPTHGTNNKHAEEFLCDIAEYIYKDIKKKPHTCIGGKKRPCMGCFSRMHCENIDSFGQHPGYFWLETMDNQPSEIALNTLQSLCCYPPSVSSCKYGRNTTSYDSGSDSDDEGEDNRANKMKLTTTTIPPAKQPQQLISPPSGTTSPPNNSLEKFKTTYGFNAVEAGGEGNCFFHAILAQLKLLKKSRKIADKILGKKVEDYTHQDLRRLAVQHIVDHRDWYANYMMNNETVDDFVSRMQVDGEFVEGAIVRAMAQVLDMHLVIVSNNSSTIVFRRLNTNAPILFLAHYTDLHYQSLEPNSSADIIPFDITQFDITDNLPPSTVEEYHGDNNTLTTITETLSTLSLTTENRPLIDIASFF